MHEPSKPHGEKDHHCIEITCPLCRVRETDGPLPAEEENGSSDSVPRKLDQNSRRGESRPVIHATRLLPNFKERAEVDKDRSNGLRQRGGKHQTVTQQGQSLLRRELQKTIPYAMKMENRLTCRPATELGALKKVNPMLQVAVQSARRLTVQPDQDLQKTADDVETKLGHEVSGVAPIRDVASLGQNP